VKAGVSPLDAAQWLLGEVLRVLKEEHQEIGEFSMEPAALAGLIKLGSAGTINRNTAKNVFDKMLQEGLSAAAIIERDQLAQVSDTAALEETVRQVIAGLPAELERYRKGEARLFGFFMGQVMRATQGKGDPKVVRNLLQRVLDED
ncbi:MAG: Asp-tRNA(Asn)/Glu-tRNA(Gln) amidotransferase GatCAB subunit B, partial [Candidatus Neomarinimicrobiota bacterium]